MLAHKTETLTEECQTCKLMIMTSGVNHDETYNFFKDNNFFGGKQSSFVFFQQSSLPAVDPEGKIIMKSPYETQLAPNGNGALFDSIKNNAMVKDLISNL
jgi:UDP-N-acetylglucosamine/UDP-N-acetylgalactosamine diphosphorylase